MKSCAVMSGVSTLRATGSVSNGPCSTTWKTRTNLSARLGWIQYNTGYSVNHKCSYSTRFRAGKLLSPPSSLNWPIFHCVGLIKILTPVIHFAAITFCSRPVPLSGAGRHWARRHESPVWLVRRRRDWDAYQSANGLLDFQPYTDSDQDLSWFIVLSR